MTRLTRVETRERTRTALREAAAELVAQHGLHGTSIEAITNRAGYSRGAFYANYSSKEELLAEVLQEQVYGAYRQMAAQWRDADGQRPTPRQTGERLAAIIGAVEGRWMFTLWLDLLAHASRNPDFRAIAADFWRQTRALIAEGVRDAQGARSPAESIASAAIALDLGLAIQHVVDPEQVPLTTYPEVFELVFAR